MLNIQHIFCMFVGVLSLLFTLSYTGCGTASGSELIYGQHATYTTIQSTTGNYAINMPVDWAIKESHKRNTLTGVQNSSTGAQNTYKESIIIYPVVPDVKYDSSTASMIPEYQSLSKYASEHLSRIQQDLPKFKVIERGATNLNGLKAYRFLCAYQDKQNPAVTLKSLMFMMQHGNDIYLANCTDVSTEFGRTRALFDEIINSLEFSAVATAGL